MALALGAGQAAHAECKLTVIATIPITFVDNHPMVDVSINGKPAHLRFQLGSDILFWGSVLKDYGLREMAGTSLGWAYSMGGATADMRATEIRELKMGDIAWKNKYYYIMPAVKKAGDEAGVFGVSAFNKDNDVEVDFAHNAVRVFNADGCKDDDVVYWGGNYSVAESTKDGFYTFQMGGKPLKGSIGVGNEVTFVTPEGARQAGVTSQSAGSLPMGMVASGLIKPIEVSIANFPELGIGDETIKNIPLAIADIFPGSKPDRVPEVVLGADFARSHRIYISRQQKKIYFSYVGGVLFQDIYKRLGAEPPPAPPRAPKP